MQLNHKQKSKKEKSSLLIFKIQTKQEATEKQLIGAVDENKRELCLNMHGGKYYQNSN